MKKLPPIGLALLSIVVPFDPRAGVPRQSGELLRLVQTIPMPNVQGRLDHSAVDLKGKRLFVAALGDNQNTVEVIDLKSGKRVASIPGQNKPQGVFYASDYKKLFVANGTDGTCKIFDARTLKPITSLAVGADADHVGYDPATKYLDVGVGDAKGGALVGYGGKIANKDHGEVGIIDVQKDERVGDIDVGLRAAEILMTNFGDTLFSTQRPGKRSPGCALPATRMISFLTPRAIASM